MTVAEAVEVLAEDAASQPKVKLFLDFVTSSERGIIR
jgi:UDP-N-acetylglucosamine acyltransferase